MDPDHLVDCVVEVVSFDDTLGEIEKIIEEDVSEDRVVSVNSVEMYDVIAEFGKMIGLDQTA